MRSSGHKTVAIYANNNSAVLQTGTTPAGRKITFTVFTFSKVFSLVILNVTVYLKSFSVEMLIVNVQILRIKRNKYLSKNKAQQWFAQDNKLKRNNDLSKIKAQQWFAQDETKEQQWFVQDHSATAICPRNRIKIIVFYIQISL